jgi:class 3 adenylate cyclase/tetratricopeptide (TPR) repeat protein
VARPGAVGPPSGTVTFLFSDIEGSTQRWSRGRAAMQEALRAHDRLMHAAIAKHGGYVFKTVGDAFCSAFTTPESAALAALDAQLALGATDFSAVNGLRVRMAINTGTADERDGDYFGPALNRVARLLSLGHGGQVLLSGIAAVLVGENPPPQASLADLGEHELKGLEGHERVFQFVAPGLQREFPELAHKWFGPWMVPDAMRTRYFTGREDLLARLRQQLVERHRAALSGLGGVGKTQSAIEYAVRHRADYPGGVFWVNAETIGGLTSGFVAIAATLRLPAAASNDHDQAVRAVSHWFGANDGWLLILDNVDNRREMHPFVPERGTGHLLITSREPVFAELGIPRALEVRDLDTEEGVRFLLARTGHEDADAADHAAAGELTAELGNLPLALEQAAAYITETHATFADYLAAFRKRRVALLEKAGEMVAHDTVSVTWAANFEAVERTSQAAADVLRISALLAPDVIPFELFLHGAHVLGEAIAEALADPDELAMAEVLQPLARYSLVRSDSVSRAFGVHRLVQEIVWTALAQSERRTYFERAVCALDAALPEVEFATWARCERLVAHVPSIAGRRDSDDVRPEVVGPLVNRTGWYLRERGRYTEAQTLHERALGICERMLGPDHLDVAHSLRGLGVVHCEQGRYAQALALHERALVIRERALGPDHADVARTLNNLGAVNLELGRYARAQTLQERALAVGERALGPDHPDVGHFLSDLALANRDQGRHADAQPLLERALAIRERALGPDHPLVAESLDGLASVHAQAGRHAEAQSLYERALAIRERVLGPDHPDVAFSLTGLSKLHVHRGRHDEAEPLFERALALRERVLGSDHAYLAETLLGLAALRKAQGRRAQAVSLYERALAIQVQTFAADHPELAEIRRNIDALHAEMAR